ncbi:HAMP domain-containing sensor histidine kinase [Paenibacillus illinoisensis]|uniref:sensor histidine kinase n=1 Tax=Paenibacillus illinoisensis TaxID=59845 RepID=UPI0030180AC1
MLLLQWSKRWLITVLILLILLLGCSLTLAVNRSGHHTEESNLSIHLVRLSINPVMLALEQNLHQLTSPEVQENVRALAEEQGIQLSYVGLDGTILFSSNPSSQGEHIHLASALHYDLSHAGHASNGEDVVDMAFPVLHAADGIQIGNAIFTIPKAMVTVQPSSILPYLVAGISIIIALILGILLLTMHRKLHKRLLSPVHMLQQHAESILKGKYDKPIHYKHADEVGELYAMFDLMRTEIKHLSEQRTKQEQAQKELITNISHDIKTPITTVKAYIEAIMEGICADEETLMEYMRIMQTHTDKTAQLVEDLLLHALQELGQISVEPREVYSGPTFEAMLGSFGHAVHLKGLTYETPESVPNVLIRMDITRIEQVLANLISNALKHTHPGDAICVYTELRADQFIVTIMDTGPGIRAQDMPFVFERYFRGQASPVSKHVQEGTGLGLSICKNIVEAHGGRISFSSKEGQGTSFQFSLPVC